MPLLSVCLATYNRAALLRDTLANLSEAEELSAHVAELVIVVNGSTDDTASKLATFRRDHPRFPPIRIIVKPRNINPSLAYLEAIQYATAPWVWLHTDDDLVEPTAVKRVAAAIRAEPAIGSVSGPVLTFRAGAPNQDRREVFGVRDSRDGRRLAAGAECLERMFLRASSIAGLVLRRDLCDCIGAEKFAASLYPQVYLAGRAAVAAPGFYLAKPIVLVRQDQPKAWSYTGDFMHRQVIDILNDVTRGRPQVRAARRRIIRKRILAAYGPLRMAMGVSRREYWRLSTQLARIPEYRRSPWLWSLVAGVFVGRGLVPWLAAWIRRRRTTGRVH